MMREFGDGLRSVRPAVFVRRLLLFALISAGTCQPSRAAASAVPLAPIPLGSAERLQLDALVVQHQKIRSQLPADQRADLDRLTDRVRASLFGSPQRGNLFDTAKARIRAAAPGLSEAEARILTAYVLDGIAAGDRPAQSLAASRQTQEMQMSFNLQYLRLQSQMQSENRSFTAVSNVMKTKHDTVKNSINNIR
jgi:hypothetical protein